MDPMARTPEHAKPAPRPEGLLAAWLCLVIAGVTTVTFNIWHAWFSGMASVIGVMEGIAPVALAMVVSHLVATSRAGNFLKAVTFAVMVGAMALSVRATGAVVRPATGPLWWLYGAVIDTAALVALQVLLSLKSRAAAESQRQAELEAAAADERTALRAELETARQAHEAAETEDEAVRAELAQALETARRELAGAVAKAETLRRKLEAASARNRSGSGRTRNRKQDAAGTRNRNPEPAAEPEPEETVDIDAEARIIQLLAEQKISIEDGILQLVANGRTPSRAGKLAGRSDSYGRSVVRKTKELTETAPKGQDPQE